MGQATGARGPGGRSTTKRELKRIRGKDGRTARNSTGNGTELAKTRVGKRRRKGRDGTAERAAHEKMGNETDRTEALSE